MLISNYDEINISLGTESCECNKVLIADDNDFNIYSL